MLAIGNNWPQSPQGLGDSFLATLQTELSRATTNAGEPIALQDLFIRTKEKQIARFSPNAIQRLYLDALAQDWQAGVHLRGTREIILKGRQFGFSTLILAIMFLDTINNPNTQTAVIAHDAESTERLFQIIQRFYNQLPPEMQPRTKYANRREFLWPDIDSSFYVGQAGSKDFGRGSTLNNVHCSEVAMWSNAEVLMTGLLQSVPADGNIFIETTANGLGNWYYSEYQAATRGDSVFTPRFFPWFQHTEYRLPVPDDFTRTEEEQALAVAYGLDDEQLCWRRQKVKELRDKFPQEYPANAAEAFLTSGNPYFSRDTLNAILQRIQQGGSPAATVEIPGHLPRLRQAYQQGRLQVWIPPQPGASYVAGADTAEGLTDEGEADFDSADVLTADGWQQAAHLHGKWDTHEYGMLLSELGRWYNSALLGVERNNHGHAVLNTLIHTADYPAMRGCSGLYCHEEYDEQKKLKQRRPGWPTTQRTKYLALDALATALEDGDLGLNSEQSVSECLTFVKLPGGRAGGEGKSHDDAVISLSIAVAMLTTRKVDPTFHQSNYAGLGSSRRDRLRNEFGL